MFTNEHKKVATICEECYRLHYYGDDSYSKKYKHCILSKSITPPISREMCHCEEVPHTDLAGEPRCLFPVDKNEKHSQGYRHQGKRCNILELGESVARAKYRGLQASVKPKRQNPFRMFNSNAADSKHDITSGDPDFIDENTEKLPQFLTGSTTSVASEATADEDIPLFFRRYTERYPFGNVHMALRVGPLVIENGVSQ